MEVCKRKVRSIRREKGKEQGASVVVRGMNVIAIVICVPPPPQTQETGGGVVGAARRVMGRIIKGRHVNGQICQHEAC